MKLIRIFPAIALLTLIASGTLSCVSERVQTVSADEQVVRNFVADFSQPALAGMTPEEAGQHFAPYVALSSANPDKHNFFLVGRDPKHNIDIKLRYQPGPGGVGWQLLDAVLVFNAASNRYRQLVIETNTIQFGNPTLQSTKGATQQIHWRLREFLELSLEQDSPSDVSLTMSVLQGNEP